MGQQQWEHDSIREYQERTGRDVETGEPLVKYEEDCRRYRKEHGGKNPPRGVNLPDLFGKK